MAILVLNYVLPLTFGIIMLHTNLSRSVPFFARLFYKKYKFRSIKLYSSLIMLLSFAAIVFCNFYPVKISFNNGILLYSWFIYVTAFHVQFMKFEIFYACKKDLERLLNKKLPYIKRIKMTKRIINNYGINCTCLHAMLVDKHYKNQGGKITTLIMNK